MPSANGTVKSDGSQLQFTFVIDGVEYRFVGTVSPDLPAFIISSATLTYDSVSSLVGTKPFAGQLGINDLRVTIGDGVSVVGKLSSPIDPPIHFTGVGTWTTSADD